MANNILKLTVDSAEYDAKLKKAAEGIRHLADRAHESAGDMTGLEQSTLDYIKSIGEMETKSRSAAGQVRELESTYKELKVIYDQLNEVEKADEGGKALAASLEQLKQRAQDAKKSLDDASKSLQGNEDSAKKDAMSISDLTSKLGINIKSLVGWGAALTAGKAALDVAKDAFFQSESNIDEWGRTVEGAKGAYNVFLDTLNNGNWSSFFNNLEKAINGGRDLYDVFDSLGSIKSNNAAAIAIVQQQIAQLRLAKQQGENVDAQLKAATARLAELQKQSIQAGKAAGNKSAFEVIRSGVNSVGGSNVNDATINYAIQRIMQNGQSEFDKYKYNRDVLHERGMVTRTQTISDSQGGTYERQYKVFDINSLTKEQQKQYALAKAITEGETRIQKGIAAYAQAVQEGTSSAREEFKGNRYALQGGSGSGKTGKGGMKTVVGIVGDQVKQTGKAIDAVYNRQAKELGLSVKEFRKGTSSMAEFDKRMEGFANYEKWNRENSYTDNWGNQRAKEGNPYQEFKKWGTFRVDGERYNSLVQLIQQRDQQAAQAYGMQSQAYRTMNRAEGITLRQIMGGGSGSGKGGTTITTTGIKDDFQDMEELVGLIPVAEQKVKDLQQQIRESWDEGEIARLTEQLKGAEDEVKRLKDIGKEQVIDPEKMFPDYSKQNYNTGYSGSMKAKIDSARQDFGLSPTNFDTINSYISGIKNALKDADLGSDLYNSLTEQLKDATTMSTMLQELMERGLQGADLQSVAEKFKTALLEGDVPDDKIKEYIDKLNEQIKNAGGIELSYNEKTGEVKDKDKKKSDRDVLKDSKQLVSGLSQVAGGLQQMGVKLPEEVQQVLGVVQGLMTVIEGVNTIIGITQTAALTANTTAMIALTAALWANTATSIIPFANGGIVPHAANGYFIGGTHMSGDVTPIMANAGELVLSRSQQGNLASQLEGGGMSNLHLETYLDGRAIRIVLNNESQGRLKGKYVTSQNFRG